MPKRTITFFTVILLLSVSSVLPEHLTAARANSTDDHHLKAIKFRSVFTGKGKGIPRGVVVIDGDKITAVLANDSPPPAGAELIDLSSYTAIPGMIDVHTHMTYWWDRKPKTNPWEQADSRMPAKTVFMAQENARKTLEAGVTTVRDLGSSDHSDIAMRDLINAGAMVGPRMFVAGYGLHVTSSPARPGFVFPDPGRADGVADVVRVVRQEVAAGVDVIKIYGSTGSDQDVTGFQTFTSDELKAGIDVAHKYGKRVAVHSYGPDGARDAVAAGADSIEHATDMYDDTIREMARRRTFYVPTIDHNRYYVDHRDEFGYGPEVVARLNDYIARNLETARRAFKAGVRFAMGSDAVFTGFGENARELEWFVKAGMTPEQALTAATLNGAELLGQENTLGSIAPGYFADITAVGGDPLKDVDAAVNKVRWVMKGGIVVIDKTSTP
ncbi:MAG TPA: amidohydrolase family protein [Blastocatellia bacterium]